MILVTGASGLLGSNFVMEAQQIGEDIIAVSNLNHIYFSLIKIVQMDLKDKEKIDELFEALTPEWVVHCAALTNVDWCEQHPYETYEINTEASRNLARAADRVGSRFIYISTDSVFDGSRGNYSENDTPSPINIYAKSKLAGERAVQDESESSLIIRTDIYGWNACEKLSLAEWILKELESNRTINGFTDVIFTPILVNDLSEIIFESMKYKLSGIYNIAGVQACSKYDFARDIAEIFNLNDQLIEPISISDSSLRVPRPRNVTLNTKKICEKLDISMHDVKSGLKRFKALRDSGFVNKLKKIKKEQIC